MHHFLAVAFLVASVFAGTALRIHVLINMARLAGRPLPKLDIGNTTFQSFWVGLLIMLMSLFLTGVFTSVTGLNPLFAPLSSCCLAVSYLFAFGAASSVSKEQKALQSEVSPPVE